MIEVLVAMAIVSLMMLGVWRSFSVTVTNGQITNNQMRNVEEGDIVKQINEYLLVLQDGRIFVVDTRGGADGGRRLALADAANVYRNAGEHMWYDEMLVFGDRVLITGYSYRHGATELSVFRLDTATVSVLGYERETPVLTRWNA